MSFLKKLWIPGRAGGTPFNAADQNRIEQAVDDLYKAVYAEDAAEVTTTATGAFQDPTSGTAGPITPDLVVPTGGRFVDIQAECEAHHSTNNTDGIWFAIAFSKDGGAYSVAPPSGYNTNTAFPDTTAGGVVYGASMWFADGVYRPLRLGQGRSPSADGTTSIFYPGATNVFLLAGTYKLKMVYGIKSGGGGTAYFRTRRLRAQVLAR